MRILSNSDTIAAISTPIGEGGIGIVRLSGPLALKIADEVFASANKIKPSKFKTYSVHYGWVVDRKHLPTGKAGGTENTCLPARQGGQKTKGISRGNLSSAFRHLLSGKIIDEVLLTAMRAPRTYTKEDVVEINCHSGIVPLREILDLVIRNGARLAEPGEFTKKAFLNGRIDLTQAEAVLDIIRAKTDEALDISLKQLGGVLSEQIFGIRERLLHTLAELEAKIDFPEDVSGATDDKNIKNELVGLSGSLQIILDNAQQGKIIREGVKVVICGLPNVGKSSLLNLLLREEKAIVTPVAGTTRDAIEDIINIHGIPLRIFDTAGILEPRDVIEDLAVKKAHSLINEADLVLVVFDGTRKLSVNDLSLARKLKGKIKIGIVNKIDLPQKANAQKIKKEFNQIIRISAKNGQGLKRLERAIEKLVWQGKVIAKCTSFFANVRHINLLRECLNLLLSAENSVNKKLSLEVIALDAKGAISALDKITGQAVDEDLLDKIFSEFCIGK